MVILYNTGIFFTGLVFKVASLWNSKAKKWVNGRKNWQEKWSNSHKEKGNYLLFQCASLGEYEQAVPLMEAYQEKGFKISVSFFSPSGYEYLIKKEHSWDAISYLPLDTKKNAKKLLTYGSFKAIFFVKYELWYHLLNQANKAGVPCYLVSATFRENHRYFKWYGGIFRKMLRSLNGIFVQNPQSQRLLENIQVKSIVSGDTRFDRVKKWAENAKKNTFIEHWKQDKKLLILGSSWPEEEDILLHNLEQLSTYKIIIAPHDLSPSHKIRLKKSFPKGHFFSENSWPDEEVKVFIMDEIGHLSSLYRYADVAFIGGGFGSSGLHNILEALCFNCPVLFGPNHLNFWEASAAISFGCAMELNDTSRFPFLINKLAQNKSNAITFIEQNAGATLIILNEVKIG